MEDFSYGVELAASAWGLAVAPTLVRMGTGMKVSTKLATTVQNRRARLRGNGRSSTGG
jgi:hypothetical protein